MTSSQTRLNTADAPRATVEALLDQGRTGCSPVLRDWVARLAPPMDLVAAYHFGWVDAGGSSAEGGEGKYLRAALALLSSSVVGAEPQVGHMAGAALELVHNFSLLHDDIMDGDRTRRHRATAWSAFSSNLAILTGDALLALSLQLLWDAPKSRPDITSADTARAVSRLTTATYTMISGQAQDMSFEQRDRVRTEECLAMLGDKTGALLGCAACIGAVLAGADEPTAEALERYGYHLGLAFQARDDLLGIWGSPDITGKPRWSDLRRRKKTLPVCAALACGKPAARHLAAFLATAGPEDLEAEDRLTLCAMLIDHAGGRAWTEQEAQRQRAQALTALDTVSVSPAVRDHFVALADFAVTRDK